MRWTAEWPSRMSPATRSTATDPVLRARLRQRGVGYVLAIARNQHVQATEPLRLRPDDIAAGLGEDAWERRSCGPGSKGERFYDWAWEHDDTDTHGGGRRLLIP